MSIRNAARRIVIAVAQRVPPRWTRRLPRALGRDRALVLTSRILQAHPVAFTASPTVWDFALSGTTEDLLQRNVHVFGEWEPTISAWAVEHLGSGDVVVDVGANVGYFSLLCAGAVGADGRVIAIEPVPSIAAALGRNVALNQAHNVLMHAVVAADETGEVEVFRGPGDNLGLSATTAAAGLLSEGKVPRARVVDLVPGDALDRVRLVKVDTEGDEVRVLRGLVDVLRRMAPGSAVLVEISPEDLAARGHAPAQIGELLEMSGFTRILRIPNPYDDADYARSEIGALEPLESVPDMKCDVVFVKPEAQHASEKADSA